VQHCTIRHTAVVVGWLPTYSIWRITGSIWRITMLQTLLLVFQQGHMKDAIPSEAAADLGVCIWQECRTYAAIALPSMMVAMMVESTSRSERT